MELTRLQTVSTEAESVFSSLGKIDSEIILSMKLNNQNSDC